MSPTEQADEQHSLQALKTRVVKTESLLLQVRGFTGTLPAGPAREMMQAAAVSLDTARKLLTEEAVKGRAL